MADLRQWHGRPAASDWTARPPKPKQQRARREQEMGEVKRRLIACAEREWGYFGGSTRSLDDQWHIVGDEADEPFRSHINHYWRAVGEPGWDGGTDEPWSAAFISWCFRIAGAGPLFRPSDTHSEYIDW